jgi:D-amino-acid dehydrogenase
MGHPAAGGRGGELPPVRAAAQAEAQRQGVQFQFNTVAVASSCRQLARHGAAFETSAGAAFDAVVLCAGVASAALLRPLGVRIPLVAVHGYSISAPIREPLNAPRSAVMDERYKVAITRLGQRVRVAGGAELGGNWATSSGRVGADALQGAARLVSGCGQQLQGVQEWKGARPMLPDGPPLVGASGVPLGLWLNLGHGSSGWAGRGQPG